MKFLKKVSLSEKSLPDDIAVKILNDEVKKKLFLNNTEYESRISGKVEEVGNKSLLERLWVSLEDLSEKERQRAIKIIRQLESSPLFQINDRLELVYRGDVFHGSNILQLVRSEVAPKPSQRILLPAQDLFYHLLYNSPSSSSHILPNFPPTQLRSTKRQKSALKKNNIPSYLKKTSKQFSPIKTRSKKNAKIKEARWKK